MPARPASAGPTASAADALARIAPARAAAFEILTRVGEGKGHSDELLHSSRTSALTLEDRNLATALVMGVLRWQIALDARLSKLPPAPASASPNRWRSPSAWAPSSCCTWIAFPPTPC